MDVVRLHALRTSDDVELHALILVQRPETRDVDGLVVDEDVFARAAVNSDETETLVGVEPFDGPQSHVVLLRKLPHRTLRWSPGITLPQIGGQACFH